MFIAVLYQSDGVIVQTMMGQEHIIRHTAEQMGLAYLQVSEQRDDYDRLFRVEGGELVALSE